jgi:hypothetical protein
MDEFLTWKYIVGVLVTSVFVNIFTHYLTPTLDRILGAISSQWKMRSEKSKRAQEDLLDKCSRDPVLVSLLIHREIKAHIAVLGCFISALIILVIGSSPILLEGEMLTSPRHVKSVTSFFLAIGTIGYFISMDKFNVLRDLRKRRLAAAKSE